MTFGDQPMIRAFHTNAAFLFAALAYLVSLTIAPYPGQFIVKALPIAILVLRVVRQTGPGLQWLTAGLMCSALADMLLTRNGDTWFLAGIAVFGLAQASYAAAFWFNRETNHVAALLAIPVLSLAVGLTSLLLPHLAELRPAVLGYVGVITLAGLSAAALPRFRWLSYVGMLTFMTSDATIAINRFVHPVPGSDLIIMATYYAAQWMIVTGLLRPANRADP